MTISKLLSFCRTLPRISITPIHAVHNVMPELYEYSASVLCVRSCVCVCDELMRVHTKKVFEGILLVKTNPPSVKAGYGPDRPTLGNNCSFQNEQISTWVHKWIALF